MNPLPSNVIEKKRRILGPTGRFILKISNWDVNGEIPNYKKMVLVGVPHTAMRDAWYGLLTVLALDLKVNFLVQSGFSHDYQVQLLFQKTLIV